MFGMMRMWRIVGSLAIGTLISGTLVLSPISLSPFATTILAHTQTRFTICPSPTSVFTEQFNVEALQVQRDGFAVYYTSECTDEMSILQPGEGFRVYSRDALRWVDVGGEDIRYYDAGCMMPSYTGQPMCCSVSTGEEGRYTAVFGRALNKDIDMVEVAFDSGDQSRMRIINGKFAIAISHIATHATLRMFARDGALLHERDLDLRPWARNTGGTGCPP
jgi:hypothetical protein